MLVYFKVGNFKSIKDPLLINFTATSISEHQETNIFEKGKDKLLKTVLLYGPNASGKSKILEAFLVFRVLILESSGYNSTKSIPVDSFDLNADTHKKPSFFEAEFIIKNKKFRYGFETDTKSVKKEWLLEVKATTQTPIFLRIGKDYKIDYKKFTNAENLETKSKDNVLFLSVADQWNVPLAKAIYAWFDSIYTIHGLMDEAYKDFTNQLLKNPVYKPLINAMIRKADLGINSIDIIEISDDVKADVLKRAPEALKEKFSEVLDRNSAPVLTMHNVLDSDGNIVSEASFSLEAHESEGTKKFYNIIGILLHAVENGRLVVIDEIDARIHTLLTKAIIRLFNGSEKKTECQLFAASHDTALMDKDLLRRDQIYFVEKDRFASTKVVNLVEYKVRKETPYYKNYLEGKYGGIPFIENLENVLNDGE